MCLRADVREGAMATGARRPGARQGPCLCDRPGCVRL